MTSGGSSARRAGPLLLKLDHAGLRPGLPVHVALTPEILQHHLVLSHALHVFRQNRDLAPATWSIDYEGWNGQATGPPTERPHDLDAGVGQPTEARHRGWGQLVGMVEVGIDKERMEPLEHGAKLRRNPLRQMAGDSASDPDDLQVRDG